MSVLVILLVCACSVWAAPSNVNITQNNVEKSSIFDPHIVGGTPSDILPYQVSIRIKKDLSPAPIPAPNSLFHFCGGSLISKNIVLTAGHCFKEPNIVHVIAAGNIYAILGTRLQNFDPKTTFITKVEKVMKHASYNPNELHHDVAVLKLKDSIPDDNPNVQPIPMISAAVAAGEKCKISGWGFLYHGAKKVTEVLQSVIIPTVDTDTCERAYSAVGFKWKISQDMICAGGEKKVKGPCQGDSGGPLVCNGNLAGVVSWGYKECDAPGFPGVYSSVAYHRDFIESAMKALNAAPPSTTGPPPTSAEPQPNSARKPAFAILSNIFLSVAVVLTGMSLKLYL